MPPTDRNNSQRSSSLLHLRLRKRISLIDKIFFLQHLEVLIRTGFSLGEALETVAQSVQKEQFQLILREIKASVEKGETLAHAMQPYPKVFPEIFRSMIRAGEISGNLDISLKQLLIQQKKRHELVSQLKNALTYPIVIVSAMILIGTGVVLFIFPRITQVFEEAEFDLPLPTRIVIGFTNFMAQNFLLIGLLASALVIGIVAWSHTVVGRRLLHQTLLRLPVLSQILKQISLASFTRNLSALLRTDIPINESFNIIATTMGFVPYRERLARVGPELEKGASIHSILEQDPSLFPSLITKIVATGEKSGTLDRLLEEIATFYESEVSNTLKNLSSLIEPILMLVIGALVALFAISILLPFYTLVQNI